MTPSSSGEPHTPAAKSTLLKSVEALKDLKNADTLGELMSDNGLTFYDKAAFNRYPRFKDKIFDIIRQERGSVMRPGSHKKFEAYLDCYARYNEATLLRKMFPLLMKDGLHLREGGNFTDAEKQQFGQSEYLAYRDFLMDEGIVETADREFLANHGPQLVQQGLRTVYGQGASESRQHDKSQTRLHLRYQKGPVPSWM